MDMRYGGVSLATAEPLSILSYNNTIMDRIKVASRKSPIAVFKAKSGLVAVFADTVKTRAIANKENPNFVGSFHGGLKRKLVFKKLNQARRR